MSLETDLKQNKPFASVQQKTFVNIIYTANCLIASMDEVIKPLGLATQQQYNILRILRGQYPAGLCLQDIKCRMLDRSSDVSRLVDRMVQSQLVTRQENPENRRKVIVTITERGLRKLEEIEPYLTQKDNIFDNIAEQDLELVNKILDTMRNTLKKSYEGCSTEGCSASTASNEVLSFDTLSQAVNYYMKSGYTDELKPSADCLHCANQELKLHPEDFQVEQFYRFEGDTNPSDESILYVISSDKWNVKGLLISPYGVYQDELTTALMEKLKVH